MSDLIRNVPKTRRTTRCHGESKQYQGARRKNFASGVAEYVPGPPVPIRQSCTCSEKPYAHQYHGDRR